MHILDSTLNIALGQVTLEGDLDYCINQLRGCVKSNKASNQGGYQGEPHSARRSEYFWMRPLMDTIVKSVKEYKPNAELHRIWFNINGPGHKNNWHKHGRDELVTVTYVKTDPLAGAIQFRQADYVYSYMPTAGDIILFNGDLEHSVLENLSDTDRISIACNFRLT